MSAARFIANSLRIAAEDLAGARVLSDAGNRNAAYLCEQAAEKILRAVLTSEGIHAGVGHALGQMAASIPDANPLEPMLAELAELAAFATSYRYPTSHRIPAPPTRHELAVYLDRVEAALRAVADRFDVDLQAGGGPARRPGPIR